MRSQILYCLTCDVFLYLQIQYFQTLKNVALTLLQSSAFRIGIFFGSPSRAKSVQVFIIRSDNSFSSCAQYFPCVKELSKINFSTVRQVFCWRRFYVLRGPCPWIFKMSKSCQPFKNSSPKTTMRSSPWSDRQNSSRLWSFFDSPLYGSSWNIFHFTSSW